MGGVGQVVYADPGLANAWATIAGLAYLLAPGGRAAAIEAEIGVGRLAHDRAAGIENARDHGGIDIGHIGASCGGRRGQPEPRVGPVDVGFREAVAAREVGPKYSGYSGSPV